MNILSALATGVLTFIATNIDDIFVLTTFFAQENSVSRRRNIVVGQYLGMAALITLSIVGAIGALVVRTEWIGLFGIVPVYMGVKMLYSKGEPEEKRVAGALQNPYTYHVAAITIGNGGDNLSVYIPLFARSPFGHKLTIVAVFLVFTGVWCYIAYRIVWNPLVGQWIKRHGYAVVPFVLIGLGGYIMWDNQTFAFLTKLLLRR